ncbi:preprotein translocase subunit [Salmonella enterica subsp. arizonae]|uniref:Preprotein translocase subunit n=1 Tax=Salmonella enterica subsp. arizonae TaxID=59203 RepID=A0A2X4W8M9_SALER|nr:preprotein translocase subunit [Salmonella enterica subsp. arizonae]
MAKQPGLDFQSAKGGLGELKRRLLFVIGALIVFRIGSLFRSLVLMPLYLPNCLSNSEAPSIEMFNMFSGGALSRAFYLCPGYQCRIFRRRSLSSY